MAYRRRHRCMIVKDISKLNKALRLTPPFPNISLDKGLKLSFDVRDYLDEYKLLSGSNETLLVATGWKTLSDVVE